VNQQVTVTTKPDARLISVLHSAGLIGDAAQASFEVLTGGVSSGIWKVTTPTRTF
jgi:hypothetical protein